MKNKKKVAVIAVIALLGVLLALYLSGIVAQLYINYGAWQENGGLAGEAQIKSVNWNPFVCIAKAFTAEGMLVCSVWS